MHSGEGQQVSFLVAFIPAFKPLEELRISLNCRKVRLGRLLFGNTSLVGGGFDLELIGYTFVVPLLMVRASGTEPFLFRTCRTFRRLNSNSQSTMAIQGNNTLSVMPAVFLMRNKEFLMTHNTTMGVFLSLYNYQLGILRI